MRYLSVCSGIEAATVAWHPLGWVPAAFSEIEAFPRAVLAHHYPDVPCHGDFTTIGADEYGPIDLLVGGTPCQSFSVAGLRKGLEDDRGNLTLQFLKLAQRTDPEWITWENVPGVISDKTQALQALLDGLETLGYVVDIDILDAQYFGVPQRRRRVFICGQKARSILKQRTLTSALTIAQCLAECLLLTLAVLSDRSKLASESCGFDVTEPGHSLKRRIKLFGLDSAGAASNLAGGLAVLQQSSALAQSGSASASGSANCATSAATKSAGSNQADAASPSIGKSLNAALAEALATMNECITSTSTSATTASKIYTCATVLLRIVAPITQSMESSPSFWSAVSSSSTALREFITYARSASSDLFTELEWLQPWHDFLGQAAPLHDAILDLRGRNFGQVLPIGDSLSGNPPPRREKGQDVAGTLKACAGKSGTPNGAEEADRLIYAPDSANCLQTTCDDYSRADGFNMIAHSLRAEGLDASEDGTGRGTPIIPIDMRQASRGATMTNNRAEGTSGGAPGTGIGEAGDPAPTVSTSRPPAVCFTAKDYGADASDISPTLRSGGHDASHANGGVMPAVAFRTNQTGAQGPIHNGDAFDPLATDHPPAVCHSSAVRRLTPRECARLQGFPDDYLDIIYRGKPAADGPKYKALGNSFAVPVVRWIGERIQMVEALSTKLEQAA